MHLLTHGSNALTLKTLHVVIPIKISVEYLGMYCTQGQGGVVRNLARGRRLLARVT